jgi:hypothetical protein
MDVRWLWEAGMTANWGVLTGTSDPSPGRDRPDRGQVV